ncbi:MAG TPA: ATP-binding protein [Gemmata sp.]|jgi:signal transduction histidine kinase/HAMP domain-containing protein|nr:ATP-binding protein [Gemmata sp.]
MTLRTRILISFVPLVVVLAGLGAIGLVQLNRTGGRIDAILKENYASVQAMFLLNEALERIDSSFQFALSTQGDEKERDARNQFEQNWKILEEQFEIEEKNITILPQELILVNKLRPLKDDYLKRGKAFFGLPRESKERNLAYYGHPNGLFELFKDIKEVTLEILRINRENMEQARDEARDTARISLIGFGGGLAVFVVLIFGIAWYLLRVILVPIRTVTEAAQAIAGSGQLDRSVPVHGRDELGRLAESFNAMTRQLLVYRRSNLDKMMRAQRTAQATIDSFPDPVLVVDPTGRVELSNPASRLLFGVGPTTTDEPGPIWQPPESLRQPVSEALRVQQTYQPEGFDQAVTFRLESTDHVYLPQVRPIRDVDGDTLGAAVVLNDITRFRLLDQFKSDLVATVSHELKTPLTSVRLAVHVLLEETIGPLTPKQTELLVDARDNAERLLTLIDQLLALAHIQRPQDRTVIHPTDPIELLRQATDAIRPRTEDKHITLELKECEPLPPLAIDPTRMAQALGNLLNNAVTYTPAGGRVSLSAGLAPDGRITLTVSDTGVGIPLEYQPHVFDQFFRIPGHSDETGTGLGLAIVKEVVTSHGGQITCESEPGKGTKFQITLPAWPGEKK